MIAEPKELKIDMEFEALCGVLNLEEKQELKEDLKIHGCIAPILTWNGMIVDGHNRYGICIKNSIPFETKAVEFEDRDAAKIWIITNQLARRNIAPYKRLELIEERDNLRNLRLKAKEKSLSNLNNNPANKMAESQNTTKGGAVDLSNLDKSSPNLDGIRDDGDNTPLNYRKVIAEEVGVGIGTVARMKYIKKKADEDAVAEEVLKQLRSGKVSVSKVYSDIKKKQSSDEKSDEKPSEESHSDPSMETNQAATPSPEDTQRYETINKVFEAVNALKPSDITEITDEHLRNLAVAKVKAVYFNVGKLLRKMGFAP